MEGGETSKWRVDTFPPTTGLPLTLSEWEEGGVAIKMAEELSDVTTQRRVITSPGVSTATETPRSILFSPGEMVSIGSPEHMRISLTRWHVIGCFFRLYHHNNHTNVPQVPEEPHLQAPTPA